MKNSKHYNLSDFKEEDIKKAKEFLKKAIIGFVTTTVDEKVDIFIDQIKTFSFCGTDTFSINWEIETIGNDILASLGCAINEREKNVR